MQGFPGLAALVQPCNASRHPPATSGMWKSWGPLLNPRSSPTAESMRTLLRKATYRRYDLQLGAWSPLRCSQPAVAGQLFHIDQFTLNFTLGSSKERDGSGLSRSPDNLYQRRRVGKHWAEWCWTGPRAILVPPMLLVPRDAPNLEQNLKRRIFASCTFFTLASSVNYTKWSIALQYIQVATICCLNGNHPGVSLLFQVHKQCAPTDL